MEPCDYSFCPAEAALRETLNPYHLREHCSVARPDLRPLFSEGLQKEHSLIHSSSKTRKIKLLKIFRYEYFLALLHCSSENKLLLLLLICGYQQWMKWLHVMQYIVFTFFIYIYFLILFLLYCQISFCLYNTWWIKFYLILSDLKKNLNQIKWNHKTRGQFYCHTLSHVLFTVHPPSSTVIQKVCQCQRWLWWQNVVLHSYHSSIQTSSLCCVFVLHWHEFLEMFFTLTWTSPFLLMSDRSPNHLLCFKQWQSRRFGLEKLSTGTVCHCRCAKIIP